MFVTLSTSALTSCWPGGLVWSDRRRATRPTTDSDDDFGGLRDVVSRWRIIVIIIISSSSDSSSIKN